MAKLNVAILFGGRSSEHSISCATASGVLSAIDREKYNVIPVGITRDGLWVSAVDDVDHWALTAGELPEVFADGSSMRFDMDGSRRLTKFDAAGAAVESWVVDVVLPLLHGPFGEDGTMQGYLELVGVPYSGNGVFASAAGMDKEFTKALFEQAGVPVTPHVVITEAKWVDDPESALEAVRGLGGLPVFVKPARAGSSVGVSKVNDWNDFAAAVALGLEHDSKVVVEHGIVGREVECAVLEGRGDSPARVSVAGEIVVKGREFYDFEAKYRDESSVDLICPADVKGEQLAEMQRIARKAFAALGCQGLARVDFFLTKDGFLVNEINTMPGFTPLSMFPKCWQASGIEYPQLIDELIELALERANKN